ncbi:MAG TPA: hypothetical protein PL023_08910 [Thiobacillus sp.]|nr:hypothetical protein [Thiobacillus sp.]
MNDPAYRINLCWKSHLDADFPANFGSEHGLYGLGSDLGLQAGGRQRGCLGRLAFVRHKTGQLIETEQLAEIEFQRVGMLVHGMTFHVGWIECGRKNYPANKE